MLCSDKSHTNLRPVGFFFFYVIVNKAFKFWPYNINNKPDNEILNIRYLKDML